MIMQNIDQMSRNGAFIGQLLDHLDKYGVTVPKAQEWRDRRSFTDQPMPTPEPPANLLDVSHEQMRAFAEANVLYSANSNSVARPYTAAMRQLQGMLDQQMRLAIHDHAKSIIDGLRPAFDKAANGIRAALAKGVQWNDTIETLFQAPEARRKAWLDVRPHAAALDDILTARRMLTYVANVFPALDQLTHDQILNIRRGDVDDWDIINWGAMVTKTGRRLDTYNSEAPWQRWLKVGADLQLMHITGDNFAALAAMGTSGRHLADKLKAAAKAKGEAAALAELGA